VYRVNSPASILSHRRSLSNIRHMCSGHTEDWFRTRSRKMFAEGQQAIDICAAVEAAFSRHSFEDLDENGLKGELGKIYIPFAPPAVFRAASFQSPYNFLQPPIPGNNSADAMNCVTG